MTLLKKNLTVGDAVHFIAPRFEGPVPAIVTRIEFDPSCDDTRHVSLTIFAPKHAPMMLTSIQHHCLWKRASHDLDGYWDWPAPSASVGA